MLRNMCIVCVVVVVVVVVMCNHREEACVTQAVSNEFKMKKSFALPS